MSLPPSGLPSPSSRSGFVAETGFGLALLLGVRLRHTALGTACLLLSFGVSMTLSLPAADQFHYCVFALAAGMLGLSTAERYPVSLDSLFTRTRNP